VHGGPAGQKDAVTYYRNGIYFVYIVVVIVVIVGVTPPNPNPLTREQLLRRGGGACKRGPYWAWQKEQHGCRNGPYL